MIRFARGNLLDADVEAVVNTVNTVGVMGKGIALMFKEAHPENFRLYAAACKRREVQVGRMFVTERGSLTGPRWIINFPTKQHWRDKTRIEWIDEGLDDLRRVVQELGIRSVAIPPLGCGQGGLRWRDVRPRIEKALADFADVDIVVYEPTSQYQNVAKKAGVEELTPARALIAELVRRYWVLGIECSLLEVQKLAWFLEQAIERRGMENPLQLQFKADRYGPYADRLRHLLDSLDGSYLHCERRLADARPSDPIWFDEPKRDRIDLYLRTSPASAFTEALEETSQLIDGFQSPHGMELLATVDWLLVHADAEPTVPAIREQLKGWPGGPAAAARKLAMFDDRLIELALDRLAPIHAATVQ
jgi:O-acetyl-ADP-ribose deacetylase (regulator of RNase III)